MGTPTAMQSRTRPERTTPLRAATGSRIGAGVLAIAALLVLSAGAWISPAPEGHGSHTQLGLSACQWAVWFDKPCPSCGMTTSFAHAGEGQWIQSAMTQPFAFLLVIGTSAFFWGATVQAATGARMGDAVQGHLRPRVFVILAVLLLAAWGYKITTW